ncbi:MAG: replication initiation protein [Nanobdellota archaeon]
MTNFLINDELILKKHSASIHISNDITLIQRKVYNALIFNASISDEEEKKYCIDLSVLKHIINSKNISRVKDAIRELEDIKVEWNILNKDKTERWGIKRLISDPEIDTGSNRFYYNFSEDIREKLKNPEIFANINLRLTNKFKSKYSLVLYEIVCDYKNINKTPAIEIEKLRKLFGLPEDKYNKFNNFKIRVLDQAVNDVNEQTNFDVSYNKILSGKKVTGVQFFIKQKTGKFDVKNDLPPEIAGFFIGEYWEQYSFEEIDNLVYMIQTYIETYSISYVKQNIKYALDRSGSNAMSYVSKAIKNNYAKANTISVKAGDIVVLDEKEYKLDDSLTIFTDSGAIPYSKIIQLLKDNKAHLKN